MTEPKKDVLFYRNRSLSGDSLIDRFRSGILANYPNTTLSLEKIVSVEGKFPGSEIETFKVHIFSASNPEWSFDKIFCWARRVTEYGEKRLITYSFPRCPGMQRFAQTPQEAVKMASEVDKDYSIVKSN